MADIFGEDIILWVYRFILIAIILLGVFLMIGKYYSKQDVRSAEALAISNRIIECISSNGITDVTKIDESQISKCTNIDKNEIYVNLTIASMDTAFSKNIGFGYELGMTCASKEKGIKIQYDIECLRRKFYVLLGNEKAKLDLLVGIKKLEKNV